MKKSYSKPELAKAGCLADKTGQPPGRVTKVDA
jgi:hypothetical protein